MQYSPYQIKLGKIVHIPVDYWTALAQPINTCDILNDEPISAHDPVLYWYQYWSNRLRFKTLFPLTKLKTALLDEEKDALKLFLLEATYNCIIDSSQG